MREEGGGIKGGTFLYGLGWIGYSIVHRCFGFKGITGYWCAILRSGSGGRWFVCSALLCGVF